MQIHLHFRDKVLIYRDKTKNLFRTQDLFKEEQHPRSKGGNNAGQFVKKGEEGGSTKTDRPRTSRSYTEEQPKADTGGSTRGSGGNGVRSDGLAVSGTHKAAGSTFHEIKPSSQSAHKFADYITQAKNATKYGAAVHVYHPEDYAGMRTFLTEDGTAGFALHGDDIVSAFKAPNGPPGVCKGLLEIAVQQGGRRLDCFDTVLPYMYSQSGFKAVARMPFNPEYKPDDWDYDTFVKYNEGKPDVVFMAYDPKAELYKPGDGKVIDDYDEGSLLQHQELGDTPEPSPRRQTKKEAEKELKEYRAQIEKDRIEAGPYEARSEATRVKNKQLVSDLAAGGFSRGNFPDHRAREIANNVAEYLSFTDTPNIHTTHEIKHFTLNGREASYAGSFSRDNGEILLYMESVTPEYIDKISAHEITHAKWQQLFDAYEAQRQVIDKEKDNLKPGEDFWEVVLNHDGSLRDAYKEKYPLYAEMFPYMKGMKPFEEDDGITDYSREWWKAYNEGTANSRSAVHETFAEMGMLDYEGTLRRLLWFKNSKVYKPIYDIMTRFHENKMKDYNKSLEEWEKAFPSYQGKQAAE